MIRKRKMKREGAKTQRVVFLASRRLGVKNFLFLLLVASLALSLSACGKRAVPDPPPGEKSNYPRVYPNPNEQQ